MGSQWFWSYSYDGVSFDSFMIADSDLNLGDLRQLAVDNYLVLPINTSIRLVVSSNDIIPGLFLVRYWDRGVLEAIGPTGLLNLFHYSSFKLEMVTGFIPHYILFTVGGMLVLLLLI